MPSTYLLNKSSVAKNGVRIVTYFDSTVLWSQYLWQCKHYQSLMIDWCNFMITDHSAVDKHCQRVLNKSYVCKRGVYTVRYFNRRNFDSENQLFAQDFTYSVAKQGVVFWILARRNPLWSFGRAHAAVTFRKLVLLFAIVVAMNLRQQLPQTYKHSQRHCGFELSAALPSRENICPVFENNVFLQRKNTCNVWRMTEFCGAVMPAACYSRKMAIFHANHAFNYPRLTDVTSRLKERYVSQPGRDNVESG